MTTYGIGAGLWLTGVLWLIFHYFMVRQTAFGPAPDPWEHRWLSMHGLFAFATLWVFGVLWGRHIVAGWRSGQRRATGTTLFLVLIGLVITGYLLYYPLGDDSPSAMAIWHWAIGLPLVIVFLIHRFWPALSRGLGQVRVEGDPK